jgi:reactive intermediate/imine deaminase
MKVISTPNAPAAIGPYSQGYIAGGFVYTSGQIPVDPATGVIPESVEAQAEQSCRNVIAVLEAAGVTADKVVKTTCFISDMNQFAAFNAVYEKFFVSRPARSCVEVARLPKDVFCEIEAVAELD